MRSFSATLIDSFPLPLKARNHRDLFRGPALWTHDDWPAAGVRSIVVLFGRLIRLGNRRIGPDLVYVVAEIEPVKALEIIRQNVAGPHVELEDLGRVSAKLLDALGLKPGEFTRT
jgi:hypothetical protein